VQVHELIQMHKAASVTALAVEKNDSVSYNAQMSKLLRDE